MIGVVARQLYINSNTNACISIAFQENAKNYYFVNSTKPALHGVTFRIYIYKYSRRNARKIERIMDRNPEARREIKTEGRKDAGIEELLDIQITR